MIERDHRSGGRAVLALASLLVLSVGAPAADQPQWGERFTRNMVSGEKGLPETFDPASGRNVKWAVELGRETHATPVIGGGRVVIGTNNGRPRDARHKGDRGVVLCLDEKDGHLCWQLLVPKRGPTMFWDWPNSGICSTATIEGRRVYVVSNRGEVMALDLDGLANGNDGPFQDEARHAVPAGTDPIPLGETDADILWLYDLTTQSGVRQHDAAHASILVHGQYLYANTSNGVDDSHRHIDAPDAPSLVVFDRQTGRLVARDDEHIGPRIFHSTWSSPALATIDGQPVIVFCGGDGVIYGFEALPAAAPGSSEATEKNLRRLWRFDCDPGGPKENVHQYNGNRQESPSNIKSMPVVHDGCVYVTVGGDLWWGKNEAWLQCVELHSGSNAPTLRWSYPLQKHSMSTPAVEGGLVYAVDCGRRVHCVEASTGKPLWTHDTLGDIWASPYVADGKVYVGTRKGEFLVFAAQREKKLLTSLMLDSAISATPVAANGVLYVATQTKLFALQAGAGSTK